MTVYVDELRDWGWRHGRSCHMIADTEAELDAFAERIGLELRWKQEHHVRPPHFDLTAAARERAVAAGAVEISGRELVALMRARASHDED